MQTKYFFGFIICFILGVVLGEVYDFGYSFVILCAFLSLVVVLLPNVRTHSIIVPLVSLALLGFALGVLRVDVSRMNTEVHVLNEIVGNIARVRGVIIDEPDVREGYTNVVLEAPIVLGLAESRLEREIKLVKILARIPVYPELHYGDDVEVVGKVTLPKNFTPKDGVKAFDYQSYLAKDNIYYQMYFPELTVISHGNGNMIREKLFTFKTWLIKNISENIPEPEASLASGITLGAKQSLGENLIQKFRETGVAHIVVLSGYNIAVVAGIISRLIMFMPFSIRLTMSALGITLFAVMVGGGATVVRATVMALVVILARMIGRESDALRVLVLAGGLMVFVNPMILLHDISFQLSFSATLAIVVFAPVIEKYFLFVSNRILREIVVTTFATQFFVLPLILYHMGSVSLVGFIANIFVLPVIPVAMLVVAFVAILGWVPLVGSTFAFVAYGLLAYTILAVEFFARFPLASLHNISFPLPALIISYLFLAIVTFRFRSRFRGY